MRLNRVDRENFFFQSPAYSLPMEIHSRNHLFKPTIVNIATGTVAAHCQWNFP